MYKLSVVIAAVVMLSCQQHTGTYVCDPCNLPCDTLTFDQPGTCPHCGMKLIKKSDLLHQANLVLDEIDIVAGSGVFLVRGGVGKEESKVRVFYHSPEKFSTTSKILIIVPGAGRNADSYRDAWIEISEKYNVLILSPMYEEADYPFIDYHLGGIIKDANIRDCIQFVDDSNVAILDETKLRYTVSEYSEEWIFDDFDNLFERVVAATNSSQANYDMFGHSAGGQILHRLAIFHSSSKANRIIAANSGFFTLPAADIDLPFGIRNTSLDKENLVASFGNNLVVMVGELDNADEGGGTLLRSPTVDQQGLHRLERGKYFYDYAQSIASEMDVPFNWDFAVVPDVGHNHRLMAIAAADLLYEAKSH